MRTIGLISFCLLAILLPSCRRTEPEPKVHNAAVSSEAPRKGDRSKAVPGQRQVQGQDRSPVAEFQRRGGREIGQAKLSASQNRLLDQHRRKRMPNVTTEASSDPLAELLSNYESASNVIEKVDALNGLAGREDPAAFQLLMQAATQGEPSERIAALEALAQSPRAEHLPAVEAALHSDDLDVRLNGLSLLSLIHSESALPLWSAVLNHSSAEVTQLGFEHLAELPANLQVPIAQQALARKEPWMTEQSLNLLGGIASKSAVETLIAYVEHPTSGDLAQSGLFFLLSEHFDTVSQAIQWWKLRSESLGPDLQPKALN